MRRRAQNEDRPIGEKISKAVWRGNKNTNREIREGLIAATARKSWADVMDTGFEKPDDAWKIIQMNDLCKYMFVIHTEGVRALEREAYACL